MWTDTTGDSWRVSGEGHQGSFPPSPGGLRLQLDGQTEQALTQQLDLLLRLQHEDVLVALVQLNDICYGLSNADHPWDRPALRARALQRKQAGQHCVARPIIQYYWFRRPALPPMRSLHPPSRFRWHLPLADHSPRNRKLLAWTPWRHRRIALLVNVGRGQANSADKFCNKLLFQKSSDIQSDNTLKNSIYSLEMPIRHGLLAQNQSY